jgi:homoserine dehydrogenase
MNQIQVALLGFGNVARAFAEYSKTIESLSPRFTIRAVADSSGGIVLGSAEDLDRVLAHKSQGRSISEFGPANLITDPREFVASLSHSGAQVVIESLPTNIENGQPALDLNAFALSRGLNVVTVDKGPLVHGFERLHDAAASSGSRLGYSGTTGVPIPDELVGQRVFEIAGVLNGTTNHILTEMLERESSFDAALARAQTDGVAEPDPSLDIDGWDTAAKILILAKSLMNSDITLSDAARVGINADTEALIQTARATGQVVRLVGRARKNHGRSSVSVAPELVTSNSPFFSVRGTSKRAVFGTEHAEVVSTSRSGRDAISQTIVDDLRKILA